MGETDESDADQYKLNLINQGNANLVFQVSSDTNNTDFDGKLLRVCKKTSKLSENNDFTSNVNYTHIEELRVKFHSIEDLLLDYKLIKIHLSQLDHLSKETLKQYFMLDEDYVCGYLMPNMAVSTKRTHIIDYFTKIHFTDEPEVDLVWECKPKWGYYSRPAEPLTDQEPIIFCRNCCHNYKRRESLKKGVLCFCQLCEFSDPSILLECLESSNVPSRVQKRLVDYFTSDTNNVILRIYQLQYDLLREGDGFHPLLMLLRDVSCFVKFRKDGSVECKISDIDAKHISKKPQWEAACQKLIKLAREKDFSH